MGLKQWMGLSKTLRFGRELGRGILHLPPATSVTLCSLPEDILVCILSHCDLRDLLSCMSVCRVLGTVIRTNACLLRYKTLLAVSGMVEGLADHPGKYQMLLDYVSSAGSGTYRRTNARYNIPLIDAGNRDWTVSLSLSSCVSYIVTKPREAVADVYAPPEVPGSRAMRHWTVSLDTFPGESTRAIAVDPAQDLLFVFREEPYSDWGVTVHIRMLSDPWKSHPDAVLPTLHTALCLLACGDISGIQIYYRYVAWSNDNTCLGSQIEIWDWQAGRMVWRHQFGENVSFALLDAAHILVSFHWDLRVYQFDPSSDPTIDILRLNLPARTNHCVQASSIPCPPPNAPFWPDPELRMIVLFYYQQPTRERGVLLIPYATIKKLLRNRPPQSPKTLQPHVEWEAWKHDTLRLSLSVAPVQSSWSVYQYYSFGPRFSLLMSNWAKFPRSSSLVTFDLNPWAIKYARSAHSAINMPHLKGSLGSGWKRAFRASEQEESSSVPYAVHHGFRVPPQEGGSDGGFTVIGTDPFGYTEVFNASSGQRSVGFVSYSA